MGRVERSDMSGKVSVAIEDGVATLSFSNPPINALDPALRADLLTELGTLLDSDSVRAVVLSGEGGTFATGALDMEAPHLSELCDRVEEAGKPVVAAIDGAALGGGLELALACHARIARRSARLGSPDISVGVVPGAGATQRLPRLVGGLAALRMLLSGKSVTGQAARSLGLVDDTVEDDPRPAAVAKATALADSGAAPVRTSQRRDRLGKGKAFLDAVAMHRRVAARAPLDAPMRMIECVEAALLLPIEAGRGLEEAAWEDTMRSDAFRALRHVLTAERLLKAGTRVNSRIPSRPVQTVGLVGARGLSGELAVFCLDAGFDVIVAEGSDEALEAGVMRIIERYDARVARGAMKEAEVEKTLDRLTSVCGFRALAAADFVFDPAVAPSKARIERLDAVMKAGAVLAVGALTADAAAIGQMTSRPADVIGMRFAPGGGAHRLVEIAPADGTGPRAMSTARRVAQKLDRLILQTGPAAPGVGARLAEALHAAADLCLEDGATVERIDKALRDWGLPMGSFAWRDALGLPFRSGRPAPREGRGAGLDAHLARTGRTGRGAGRGYYLYRQRGRTGQENPEVARLMDDFRAGLGLEAMALSGREIRDRCIAAMAGAGAAMLADGTVQRPSDIDMVAIHALGVARHTGGPMFAADLIGLDRVERLLVDMSRQTPRIAAPPRMIRDLAGAKAGFADLNR